MAIAFDAKTEDVSTSLRNSASFSHTCSGSDRLILVFLVTLHTSAISASSVTYNSVALTQQAAVNRSVTGGTLRIEIWSLANPASGSNTVSVSYSGLTQADAVVAISYTGVHQSSPIGATSTATGNSSGPTDSITTTTANSLIVGGLGMQGADTDPFSPGSGTTERWDGDTGGGSNTADIGYAGGEESAPTATSYTFDFTSSASDHWVIAEVEVKEAAAAAGAIINQLQAANLGADLYNGTLL